jgi:putative flippase GtrA
MKEKQTPSGIATLWKQVFALCKKHEEIIRYLVVGGLTTALSIGAYALALHLLKGMGLADAAPYIANIFSFVVAVTFAYFANKLAVFRSETTDRRDTAREAGSFFLMRLVSLGFEQGGLWLLLHLGVGDLIAKIPLQVIVVLLNYVFSKLFIFRKPATEEERKEGGGKTGE